jgi:hypothetical protein
MRPSVRPSVLMYLERLCSASVQTDQKSAAGGGLFFLVSLLSPFPFFPLLLLLPAAHRPSRHASTTGGFPCAPSRWATCLCCPMSPVMALLGMMDDCARDRVQATQQPSSFVGFVKEIFAPYISRCVCYDGNPNPGTRYISLDSRIRSRLPRDHRLGVAQQNQQICHRVCKMLSTSDPGCKPFISPYHSEISC